MAKRSPKTINEKSRVLFGSNESSDCLSTLRLIQNQAITVPASDASYRRQDTRTTLPSLIGTWRSSSRKAGPRSEGGEPGSGSASANRCVDTVGDAGDSSLAYLASNYQFSPMSAPRRFNCSAIDCSRLRKAAVSGICLIAAGLSKQGIRDDRLLPPPDLNANSGCPFSPDLQQHMFPMHITKRQPPPPELAHCGAAPLGNRMCCRRPAVSADQALQCRCSRPSNHVGRAGRYVVAICCCVAQQRSHGRDLVDFSTIARLEPFTRPEVEDEASTIKSWVIHAFKRVPVAIERLDWRASNT